MSTKTTFKRIALVAVAALGFGVLSVAPSNAGTELWQVSLASAPSTCQVGSACSAVVLSNVVYDGVSASYGNLATVGAQLYSRPADSAVLNASSLAWSDNTNVALTSTTGTSFVADAGVAVWAGYTHAAQWQTTAAAGLNKRYVKLSFTPDIAGTYLIRVFGAPQATTSAVFVDWNVTVSAKDPITAAASTLTPSATSLFAAKAIGTAGGTIRVQPNNVTGNASTTSVSATVSGVGLVGTSGDYTTAGRVVNVSNTSDTTLYFFADGTSGVSTITISAGSVVLGTQTVTYYGSVASLTATVKKPVANTGVATTGVISVVAKDAAGVVVPSQGLTVTSASTTKIASFSGATSASISEAAAGTATINLTGIADSFGTVALTISDTATGLVSTTASVIVSSPEAATVTMSFDKSEYLPGEKATLTITAKDANGLPVANQLANAAAGAEFAWVANLATTSTLPADATFSNGAMAVTLYAPGYTGAFSVGATLVGGTAWATALDDTSVSASANIITDGVAQAAADAAAEATDAANAATDAANAAAEAADAATAAAQDAADAVAALATQVSEQIQMLKDQNDALRKQLVALTNLIIKIQKKVKA